MQYNITIKHKPGLLNKADALSQWPNYPQGTFKEEIAFPPSLFINELTINDIHLAVESAQNLYKDQLQELHQTNHLILQHGLYYYNSQLIVLVICCIYGSIWYLPN